MVQNFKFPRGDPSKRAAVLWCPCSPTPRRVPTNKDRPTQSRFAIFPRIKGPCRRPAHSPYGNVSDREGPFSIKAPQNNEIVLSLAHLEKGNPARQTFLLSCYPLLVALKGTKRNTKSWGDPLPKKKKKKQVPQTSASLDGCEIHFAPCTGESHQKPGSLRWCWKCVHPQ